MNKNGFSFGPGAASLLLMAVLLSMSVLGILNLVAARNDERLSERSVRVTEQVYRLNAKAEESLAQLDEVLAECAASGYANTYLTRVSNLLPENFEMDGNIVRWEETEGDERVLQCAVRISAGAPHYQWVEHQLIAWTDDDGMEEFD